MTIKYAYIDQVTREYTFAETRDELKDALARSAALVFVEHYCNGEAYTIVETQEDGSEKWYSPTGEARLTPAELAAEIKYQQSFANAGEMPVTML